MDKDELKHLIRQIATATDIDEQPLKAVHLADEQRLYLDCLKAVGFADIDDVSDDIAVTTAGRMFAGIGVKGVLDLPVEAAEVTGNIAEAELAARYMEGKIAAIDHALAKGNAPFVEMQMDWKECYQHQARCFGAAASEFRQGLHLPVVHIDGRVIPYNEDRSTGMKHASGLQAFFADVYARNVKAGWWTDIATGETKKRNVGELFILMVTELAEAYEAYALGAADDKLPQHPGVGVEIGDLLIRIGDFCGALQSGAVIEYDPGSHNPGQVMFMEIVQIAKRYEAIRKTPAAVGDTEAAPCLEAMDIAGMVDDKLAFNATRADHKIENRLKTDGKRT